MDQAFEIRLELRPVLRIVTTTYLEQAHFFRGDYDRVIELATGNLAALPADWTYESFGNVAPASIYDRCWLVHTLARLGRFIEAAAYEVEAVRLARATQHANTVGMAHYAAGVLYLLKGDWAKARARLEHGLAVFRAGHVLMFLRTAVASSAWVLAQLGEANEALERLREGEQLGERLAASGVVGYRVWASAPSRPRRATPGSPRTRSTCSATSRPIPTGSIPRPARRTIARRWPSPSRAACVPSSAIATSVSAGAGRPKLALEHLGTATTMYRDMDMRFWLEQAEAEMKGLR